VDVRRLVPRHDVLLTRPPLNLDMRRERPGRRVNGRHAMVSKAYISRPGFDAGGKNDGSCDDHPTAGVRSSTPAMYVWTHDIVRGLRTAHAIEAGWVQRKNVTVNLDAR
jgi:hypothetical protein